MNAKLKELIARVDDWPEPAQEEALRLLSALEQEFRAPEDYNASAAELDGIDRAIRDADKGLFVTEAEVAAIFDKYRGA